MEMENGKWKMENGNAWVPCSYLHGAAGGKCSKTKRGIRENIQ